MAFPPLLTDATVDAAWDAATAYDALIRLFESLGGYDRFTAEELRGLAEQVGKCRQELRGVVRCAERAHVSLQLVQNGLRGDGRPHVKLLRAARDVGLPVTVIEPPDNIIPWPADPQAGTPPLDAA